MHSNSVNVIVVLAGDNVWQNDELGQCELRPGSYNVELCRKALAALNLANTALQQNALIVVHQSMRR